MLVCREYYIGKSGERYFDRRKGSKSAKAQAESAKVFSPYIQADATVLDFGCGTGGIISNLKCSRRLGIEINEPSIKLAVEKGVEIFRKVSDVPNRIADVLIIHHVLEHLPDPFDTLVQLSKKLKERGRIIIVVPAEEPLRKKNRRWRANIDKHLFCWNARTIGNLLEAAGYKVDEAFVTHGGYSHYIEWARCIPWLFDSLKKIVAYTLSRWKTVCVAHMG